MAENYCGLKGIAFLEAHLVPAGETAALVQVAIAEVGDEALPVDVVFLRLEATRGERLFLELAGGDPVAARHVEGGHLLGSKFTGHRKELLLEFDQLAHRFTLLVLRVHLRSVLTNELQCLAAVRDFFLLLEAERT